MALIGCMNSSFSTGSPFEFTEEEDAQLAKLVFYFGKDFTKISRIIGTKTPKSCHFRYLNMLSNQIIPEGLNDEEEKALRKDISLYHSCFNI